jgi:hypothetical protein
VQGSGEIPIPSAFHKATNAIETVAVSDRTQDVRLHGNLIHVMCRSCISLLETSSHLKLVLRTGRLDSFQSVPNSFADMCSS